jgi:hypothetical protein
MPKNDQNGSRRTPRGKNTKPAPSRRSTIVAKQGSTSPAIKPASDDLLSTPPADPDALHVWVESVLGVRIARTPLIAHHAAPFDYLCHAFFEGRFHGRHGRLAASDAPQQPQNDHPTPVSQPPPPPSPDCIVWANRGGGKTFLGAIATLLDLLFKPGIQIRILAGSVEQGRRMHEHLRSFLESDRLESVSTRITSRRIVLRKQKSAVEILAASQTSVRGTRVQKLRCDEVDLFDPDVWSAAQLVTRSLPRCPGPWGDTVRGSVEALSTMHRPFGLMWKLVGEPTMFNRGAVVESLWTPPRGRNEHSTPPRMADAMPSTPAPIPAPPSRPLFRWGLLDVLEHCTDAHACDSCPLHDECRGRAKTVLTPLAAGHITISDAVAMKSRVGRETWDSEMLCLRPSRSNTVYPEFDPRLHVFDDLCGTGVPPVCLDSPTPPNVSNSSPFSRCIGGMDFGARAESVVLLAGVTPSGVVCILREHCRKEALVSQHLDALDRWRDERLFRFHADLGDAPPLAFIGIDPAGNARNEQTGDANTKLLTSRGYPVRFRRSDIPLGVRKVRDRLAPAWPGPTWPPRVPPCVPPWVPRRSPAGFSSSPSSPSSSSLLLPIPQDPATPRLLVHRSCTRLIECLTRYRYNERDPESLTPEKDGHDHACDALRYMILNLDAPHTTEAENYL